MSIRCAIYVRVSTTKQEEKGFSLDWQRKNLPEIATDKGWRFGPEDLYDEGSQSGETISERPKFQSLLENIKRKKYDVVLVSELERLSRAQYSKDWGVIGDVLRFHKVKVATPYQIFDINEVEDDFMFSLFGLLSKREKQKLLLRTKRGKEEAKLKGKFLGGSAPLGYKYDRETRTLKKHPDFFKLPQLIFDLRGNKNFSYRKITRYLRENYPKTIRDGRWTEKTVSRLLRKPVYIGKRQISMEGNAKLIPYVSEPLIDEKLFQKVQAIEENRKIYPVPYRKYPMALLSGSETACCGYCGYSMVTESKVRRSWFERYYRCNARWSGFVCRKSKRIRAERIEPLVLGLINGITNLPNFVKSVYEHLSDALNLDLDQASDKLKDLDKQLKDLERRQKNLLSQIEEGNLKGSLVADRIRQIEENERSVRTEKEIVLQALKSHSKKLISFDEYSKLHERFLESFLHLSEEEKRKIIKFHIRKIKFYENNFKITFSEYLHFENLKENTLTLSYLAFKRGELRKLTMQNDPAEKITPHKIAKREEKTERTMGDSATGSTSDSGSDNLGSNPSLPVFEIASKKVSQENILNLLSGGSTHGSGPWNLGSNPGPPANFELGLEPESSKLAENRKSRVENRA